VLLWSPDNKAMTVWHYHGNASPMLIIGRKVNPMEKNSAGDVLWEFTTNSFSEFYINAPRPVLISQSSIPYLPLILIMLGSISSYALFKEDNIEQILHRLWQRFL